MPAAPEPRPGRWRAVARQKRPLVADSSRRDPFTLSRTPIPTEASVHRALEHGQQSGLHSQNAGPISPRPFPGLAGVVSHQASRPPRERQTYS
jgi:hypothetical protein